jgi:hypothetical protein
MNIKYVRSHATWWRILSAVTSALVLVVSISGAARAGSGTGTDTRARCTWTVRALPDLAGPSGEVLGTDGGSRFVGTSGGQAVLWRNRQLTVLGPGTAVGVNRAGIAVGADAVFPGAGTAVLWRGRNTAQASTMRILTIEACGRLDGVDWPCARELCRSHRAPGTARRR